MSATAQNNNFVSAFAMYEAAMANYTAARVDLYACHVKTMGAGKDALCAEQEAALKSLGSSGSLDHTTLDAKLLHLDIGIGASDLDKDMLTARIGVLESKRVGLVQARKNLETARKNLDACFDRADKEAAASVAALQALLAPKK